MKLFIDIFLKRIYLFNIVAWNYRKKIGFPVCKKENFTSSAPEARKERSCLSYSASHIINEERSARFTAQYLSTLQTTVLSVLCTSSIWIKIILYEFLHDTEVIYWLSKKLDKGDTKKKKYIYIYHLVASPQTFRGVCSSRIHFSPPPCPSHAHGGEMNAWRTNPTGGRLRTHCSTCVTLGWPRF